MTWRYWILSLILVGLSGCAQFQQEWDGMTPTQQYITIGVVGLLIGHAVTDDDDEVYIGPPAPVPGHEHVPSCWNRKHC